jgi:serine/threonine-protein kinase RsbW
MRPAGMKNIRIEIPSLTENIRVVESFIDNAKEKFELDDDIYGNIMIAVTEAVNNAIKHGNRGDARKNVTLALGVEDNLIRFSIRDEGSGFDFHHLPDPTAPENLEKPSGRGIFLMKHLADEVEFRDGGKQVELRFYMN